MCQEEEQVGLSCCHGKGAQCHHIDLLPHTSTKPIIIGMELVIMTVLIYVPFYIGHDGPSQRTDHIRHNPPGF
jgi:hypothetical protein